MTKVKICGLKSMEDIEIVNKYFPDYIGFVFADSKRKISIETAIKLKRNLDKSIQTVGVFVNEPIENILEICRNSVIDVIQLHGNENSDYIKILRSKLSTPIIKAVGIDNKQGLLTTMEYNVDFVLYDTAVKGQFGGSGISFDHSILSNKQEPYFLAGGLDKENVVKAIRSCKPYCIDVSSGVETDGKKDEDKIKNFINTVRTM
jgi:phosphoribosylanthranilate isomerase